MTDFNLKAVRVKQVIAMFMAVCLTVLSVNTDVFAEGATGKAADYWFGYQAATYDNFAVPALEGLTTDLDGTASDLDGTASDLDGTTSDTNGTLYSGDVTVSIEYADGEVKIANVVAGSDSVTAEAGVVAAGQTITVKTATNEKYELISSDAKLVFKADNVVLAEQEIVIEQEAAPVKNTVSSGDDIDGIYDPLPPDTEIDPDDKASAFDGKSDDVNDKTDFVSENFVNSLDDVDAETGELKASVKKVTIYDGTSATIVSYNAAGKKQKLVVGGEVAYVATAEDSLANSTKSIKIAALEQAYVAGKDFVGYTVYNVSYAETDTKKKKPMYTAVSGVYDFNSIPVTGTTGVIAVATYEDAQAIFTNLSANVVMATNKTAKVQIDLNSASLTDATGVQAEYQKYKAEWTETVNAPLDNKGKSQAKKVVKSVAINAKAGIVTLKSGKVTSLDGSYITFTKQVMNTEGKKVYVPVNAKIDVTVYDPKNEEQKEVYEDKINSVVVAGLYGETFANLDVSSKVKQTVKVVGTTAPYMAEVKYIATSRELPVGEAAPKNVKDINAFLKEKVDKVAGKSSAITVTATGDVKAKKAGTGYVYAYTILSDKSIVVSNAFTVNVAKSTTKFTVAKNTKLKYNNKEKTAYVVKKDKVVAYQVKGVAKDATDAVAVRVLNKDGKVVLGALTKAKDKKGNEVANKYQITLRQNKSFTSDNNLVIVGQAPNGMMKSAKLTFAAK